MKTIYLVRHGKAISRETNLPDFKRSLAERGINDSENVARRLRKKKVKPSLIISSPAPRALQTARIFAKHLDYGRNTIRTRKAIYDQAEGALLQVVREIDDEHDTIMLVGHDPSFTYFAGFLVKNFNKEIPTCGVVGIKCKISSWKEISENTGKQKLFDSPRQVKKEFSYKSLRKSLEDKLTLQVQDVLREVDTETAEKAKKPVNKSTKEIARIFVKHLKKKSSEKKKK